MVRFAEEKDLERVNELRRQVNEIHVNARPDIFKAGFCQELQDTLYDTWNSEKEDIILVEREGIICGFACVNYVEKPESPYNREREFYHINELGVDIAFRRQKIASELFDFIRNDAKAKGYAKIELDMWEFNESALKFYESVGFHTYRRHMEFDNN